jgi:chromosome segregation ATPase
LVELGFDPRSVEALATLLEQTRSSRQRQSRLLAALVRMADDYVEVQNTLAQRAHLSHELDELKGAGDTLAQRIEDAQTRLATLQQQEAETRARLSHVEQETHARTSELEVLQALKAVLLGDHEQAERFWQECDQWRELRQALPALPNNFTRVRSAGLRENILALLASLCAGSEIDEKQSPGLERPHNS